VAATLADWYEAFAEASTWSKPLTLTGLQWDESKDALRRFTFNFRGEPYIATRIEYKSGRWRLAIRRGNLTAPGVWLSNVTVTTPINALADIVSWLNRTD
jgi:hypothetical protein